MSLWRKFKCQHYLSLFRLKFGYGFLENFNCINIVWCPKQKNYHIFVIALGYVANLYGLFASLGANHNG
jgi:hypothetical protein